MSGIGRMLCLYRGQSYIGFILHRGSNGFEAFDTASTPLAYSRISAPQQRPLQIFPMTKPKNLPR
jgi:hypothetical protein